MKGPRIALGLFLLATAIVHAVVAWWTPAQGDDWPHWIWSVQNAETSGVDWLAAFIPTHFTFADAMSYLLVRAPLVHVVLTPLVVVALIVGSFTLAFGRLPRATWWDVLVLVLVSASVWLGQPRAGWTLFHVSNVGMHVYGVTIAVWFVVPLRCRWTIPPAMWPLLVVGGYCVGTSSRAIATATLFGFAFLLRARRGERAPWMWVALVTLFVGTAVGYVDPPWIELPKVLRRGLEPNLVLFNVPLKEAGELISLVAAFALGNAVVGALGRRHAVQADAPSPNEACRWLLAWFLTAAWCLFGPRYGESTLLPATICLVVGAAPFFGWLAASPVIRVLLAVLAIATHLVVWTLSLASYHTLGTEGRERLAILQRTPPAEVATVPRYSQLMPSFWVLGEDWGAAAPRQHVAIGAFGLADIELEPRYRRYEINPHVEVELQTDGIPQELLAAATPPAVWAGELSVVRRQFTQLVKRLRAITGRDVTARLAVEDVQLPAAAGRPLLAAWFDGRELVAPRVSRGATQQNSRYVIRIFPPFATRFSEAWLVTEDDVRALAIQRGVITVQPMDMGLHVVVTCDTASCLVVDAFKPLF